MIFLFAFMLAVVSALGICADIVERFFVSLDWVPAVQLDLSDQNMGLGRVYWQGMAC